MHLLCKVECITSIQYMWKWSKRETKNWTGVMQKAGGEFGDSAHVQFETVALFPLCGLLFSKQSSSCHTSHRRHLTRGNADMIRHPKAERFSYFTNPINTNVIFVWGARSSVFHLAGHGKKKFKVLSLAVQSTSIFL